MRCQEFAKHLDWKLELRPSAPEYPDIFDLADIVNPDGKGLIQIVGLYDDPIDDVVLYDFDLSQIFVTPTGVFATEAAHAALAELISACLVDAVHGVLRFVVGVATINPERSHDNPV